MADRERETGRRAGSGVDGVAGGPASSSSPVSAVVAAAALRRIQQAEAEAEAAAASPDFPDWMREAHRARAAEAARFDSGRVDTSTAVDEARWQLPRLILDEFAWRAALPPVREGESEASD